MELIGHFQTEAPSPGELLFSFPSLEMQPELPIRVYWQTRTLFWSLVAGSLITGALLASPNGDDFIDSDAQKLADTKATAIALESPSPTSSPGPVYSPSSSMDIFRATQTTLTPTVVTTPSRPY